MARPRLPKSELTKAALWKRLHRDNVGYAGAKPGNKGDKPVTGTCSNCGKRGPTDVHHVGSKTRLLCRSCHNAVRGHE